MAAAMFATVLVSLVAFCSGMSTTDTYVTEYGIETNKSAAGFFNYTSTFTENSTTSAPQSQLWSPNTTELSSTSQQTTGSEETNYAGSPETTPVTQTSPERVSQETVSSASPNVSTPVNTTNSDQDRQGHSNSWVQEEAASNPGLTVVLCIFIIVLGLVLVVATVKCIRSPRSNFERLEDMPMNNVNEESPFANFSK